MFGRDGAKPVTVQVSRGRLWLMRLCAVVLIPTLLLGALELVLRVAGYGYPTSFFVHSRIEGRDFYVTNEKFGFRFLPPAQIRRPLRLRLPAEKPANAYRIFLFGESAALGDPDPTFGVARYLEVLLNDRYPGTRFEVIPAAMTAINSHALLPVARECARLEGDLWIVYMGNNEVVGPFGPSTVFGPRTLGIHSIRLVLAIETTRVGQLLEAVVGKIHDSPARQSWGGMQMFVEHKLRFDDPARVRAGENFENNLEATLKAGSGAGVPIILSTVACNLKDCSPFASSSPAGVSAAQLTDWVAECRAGMARETAGAYPEALQYYLKSAAIDPRVADLQFRIGRCFMALTNWAEARSHFELARDYDLLAFRADARINEIIEKAGMRHAGQGVHLLAAAEQLARGSRIEIPGRELFYEHVHLNFEGNYLLARAFAEKAASLFPASFATNAKSSWASAEACDRRLAVTAWDRFRLWEVNLARLNQPPFTAQPDHAVQVGFYHARLKDLKSQMDSETPGRARAQYVDALRLAPDDYLLHGNFAQFLEAHGDLPLALSETQRVSDLLPHEPVPFYQMGRLLLRQGNIGAAEQQFRKALKLRGDFWLALNELGLLRALEGKFTEATSLFSRALRAQPRYPDTLINLGFAAQLQGEPESARRHYREAAQVEPGGGAEYLNRAVESVQQHKAEQAVGSFRQAIQLKPGFWQASYLLGLELAAAGQTEEAQACFAEVLRWRPDFTSARLKLGAALVKLGRVAEARQQFEETLRLDPGNGEAIGLLKQLEPGGAPKP